MGRLGVTLGLALNFTKAAPMNVTLRLRLGALELREATQLLLNRCSLTHESKQHFSAERRRSIGRVNRIPSYL